MTVGIANPALCGWRPAPEQVTTKTAKMPIEKTFTGQRAEDHLRESDEYEIPACKK